MTMKSKVIISVVALSAAFASGRFLTPEKVRVETKTVEVEKKTDQTKIDTNKHKETTVVEVTRPDGTKEITTKTVEDSNKKAIGKSITDTSGTTDSSKETQRGSYKVTISALAGVNASALTSSPISYGASITKPILGPITLGAFALTPGIAGVSVGLTF